MEEYIPLIVSALGGTVLGPVVSKLLNGSSAMGIAGGLLGGISAHFGADAAGLAPVLGDGAMLRHLQDFVEGGVGGGLIGLIAGVAMKPR